MFVSLRGYSVDIRPLRVPVPVFPDSYLPSGYSITESRTVYLYCSGADVQQPPLVPRCGSCARLTAGVRLPLCRPCRYRVGCVRRSLPIMMDSPDSEIARYVDLQSDV